LSSHTYRSKRALEVEDLTTMRKFLLSNDGLVEQATISVLLIVGHKM